jgi:hypothetical protein
MLSSLSSFPVVIELVEVVAAVVADGSVGLVLGCSTLPVSAAFVAFL